MKNIESIVTVIVSLLLIVAVIGLIGNTLGEILPEFELPGGVTGDEDNNSSTSNNNNYVPVVGVVLDEMLAIE